MGSFLSLLTAIIMIVYSGYKFNEMLSFTDYYYQVSEREVYYDSDAPISTKDGFYVGAAVTTYDSDAGVTEDETIGTIKFFLKRWNVAAQEWLSFTELQTAPCALNSEDVLVPLAPDTITQNEQRSDFFSINPMSEADVSVYGKKLKCPVLHYDLYGNYNTDMGSQLMIVFEKCDPE